MKEIKNNLRYREVVLSVIFFDIVLVYGVNYITIVKSDDNSFGMLNLIIILGRILMDWLCMFYIWTPIRYEEYNEANPKTYILEWTILSIVEYVMFVYYMHRGNFENMLNITMIYIISYIVIRLVINQKKDRRDSVIVEQIEKDIATGTMLIGFYSFVNVGAIILCVEKTNDLNIMMSIISLIVSLISIFYYIDTMKKILNRHIATKECIATFLTVCLMHACYIGCVFMLEKIGDGFMLIGKILGIVIAILLNALYINKIATIMNFDFIEVKENGNIAIK